MLKHLSQFSPGDIVTDEYCTCPMIVLDDTKVIGLGGTYSIGVYVYFREPLRVKEDQVAIKQAHQAFAAINAGRLSKNSSQAALKKLADMLIEGVPINVQPL